ncbi:MAG: glycosyltransferase family 4 protein [Oscillospiraceae bacterium]|nr:glycosyltransferase family 4 protein [Oscillospiraceae bacterium]
MKILYVTTIGGTMSFFKSFIRELIEAGHTVDIATHESAGSNALDYFRELGCAVYPIDFSRSPLNKGNLRAIKQLEKLVQGQGYDIVHCHTPVAAACTRVACRKARKQGVRVFYTAHGFHFYKGAPLKNWLIFYPIEKLCAGWTDVLITINGQDYALAQKKLRAKKVCYMPGVGINVENFANAQVDPAAKRGELGIPEEARLLLSVGELNENKNHQVVLRAMARLNDPNMHYMIAGNGSWQDRLLQLAKELGLEKQFHLLGFRRDVAELCKTADVYIHCSYREGLPVSVMEARAAGIPVVCSDIRGNGDLINEAFRFQPGDPEGLIKAISKVGDREQAAKACAEGMLPLEQMSKDAINAQLLELYLSV